MSYRFQLAQQEFLAKHSEETLAIIRDATVSVNRQDQKSDSKSKQHDLTGSMMKLLRVLLTQNPESSAKLCIQKLTGQQPAFIAALQKTLDCLLDFDLHCGR